MNLFLKRATGFFAMLGMAMLIACSGSESLKRIVIFGILSIISFGLAVATQERGSKNGASRKRK